MLSRRPSPNQLYNNQKIAKINQEFMLLLNSKLILRIDGGGRSGSKHPKIK